MTIIPNKPDGGERRDCIIRALATLTDYDYLMVAEWLRVEGFKRRNCGTHTTTFIKQHPVWHGWQITEVWRPELAGRFLILTKGHGYAVVDGKRYDTFHDTRPARAIFRFDKITSGGDFEQRSARAKALSDI